MNQRQYNEEYEKMQRELQDINEKKGDCQI